MLIPPAGCAICPRRADRADGAGRPAMFGDGVRDILDPRLKGGVGSYNTKKLRRAAERMSRQKAAAE